jgi:hypothetical protein
VLDGDAADGEVLRDANVARADALVAICDADGTNADVLEAARRLLTAAGRPGPPPITGKALTIMTTPTTSTTQPHTASRSETSSAALVVGFCSKTSESVTAMSPSIMLMMPSSRRMDAGEEAPAERRADLDSPARTGTGRSVCEALMRPPEDPITISSRSRAGMTRIG